MGLAQILYFILVARPWATRRRTIKSVSDLETLERELKRRRPRVFPRYIRNLPALRHSYKAVDELWVDAMIRCFAYADFILFDLTNLPNSEGLKNEFNTLMLLIKEKEIKFDQVLFVCVKRDEQEVKSFLKTRGYEDFYFLPLDDEGLSPHQHTIIFGRAGRAIQMSLAR